MTPRETAELLRVSVRTVSRLAKSGWLPVHYVGRHPRFDRQAMLTRIGVLSKREARRLDRQAQAEMYAAVAARLLRDAMMRVGGGRYRRHNLLSTSEAETLVVAELHQIVDALPHWLPQRVTP